MAKETKTKEIKKEEKKVVTPAEKKEEKKSFKLTSKQKEQSNDCFFCLRKLNISCSIYENVEQKIEKI